MNTPQACIECVERKMIHFAKTRIADKKTRTKFLHEAIEAITKCSEENDNVEMEASWERVAKKYLNTYDVHAEEKEKFQNEIMGMKEDIEDLLSKSDDMLSDAIRFSIAGNIIDFSTMQAVTFEMVKDVIDKVKDFEFDEELFKKFLEDIKKSKEVVILLDNVGEVVFDSILVKTLKTLYPDMHITAIPSSYPVSSDTTMKEVYESGMAWYADIVPNGNDITGTLLSKCSNECVEAIENADLIISKGMANFESMAGSDYNIYYFFICKCKLYADMLECEMFEEMFLSDKFSNTKVCKRENWKELGLI